MDSTLHFTPSRWVKYKGCNIYQTRHEYIMRMEDLLDMEPCAVDESMDDVFERMYQRLTARRNAVTPTAKTNSTESSPL